jgi:endoribonuclease Dicer
MVSNAALASLCISSGLQEHIVFESPILAKNIQAYAVKLEAKKSEEYALAQQAGRSPGQYWLDVEPPKVCPFSDRVHEM